MPEFQFTKIRRTAQCAVAACACCKNKRCSLVYNCSSGHRVCGYDLGDCRSMYIALYLLQIKYVEEN